MKYYKKNLYFAPSIYFNYSIYHHVLSTIIKKVCQQGFNDIIG
jgi:hypothetical protein